MRVVWTDQAFLRLAELSDFIARNSPEAADRVADQLIRKGDALADFPERGRVVPELPGSGLRELIQGNYRIVYRVRRARIEILTVFEGHMSFPEEDIRGREGPG